MRKTLVVALVAAALIGGASTAGAINTYNSQPAPERTEVGAYVALWDNDDDGMPDRFDWVCSGAMIDADTFLTAAHCTTDWPEGTRHFVSLLQDFQARLDAATGTPAQKAAQLLADGSIVEGDPFADPGYPGNGSDAHDIGVLDFADRAVTPADVWTFTPARLPTAGQLDMAGSRTLAQAAWTVVGYGTSEAERGAGRPHPPQRRRAPQGPRGLQRPQQDVGAARHERDPRLRRRLLRRLRRTQLRGPRR